MMDTNRRWTVAVHESAHCIAAIRLGGRCHSAEIAADGDTGFARCDELGPDRYAFMAASGPGAEYLADEYSPPDLPLAVPVPIGESLTADVPTFAMSHSQLATLALSQSDEMVIAAWAVRDHEGDFDSWSRRARFCHYVAAEIVSDNVALIVAVATELFRRGRLDAAEILEIIHKEF